MRKGASLIFEQVLLFMIGITIFLVCFTTFKAYETYFAYSIAGDQLAEVSDWITSKIVSLSGSDGVNSTLRVRVPAMLGNEPYEIELTQEGLNLTGIVTGRNLFSPMERVNGSFSLGGRFSTVHGSEFLIYKRGSQIIIG